MDHHTVNVGQYYCWNRTYDINLGRWTTPDPVATPWWNLFDYSQPALVVDPSGLGITDSLAEAIENCDVGKARKHSKGLYGKSDAQAEGRVWLDFLKRNRPGNEPAMDCIYDYYIAKEEAQQKGHQEDIDGRCRDIAQIQYALQRSRLALGECENRGARRNILEILDDISAWFDLNYRNTLWGNAKCDLKAAETAPAVHSPATTPSPWRYPVPQAKAAPSSPRAASPPGPIRLGGPDLLPNPGTGGPTGVGCPATDPTGGYGVRQPATPRAWPLPAGGGAVGAPAPGGLPGTAAGRALGAGTGGGGGIGRNFYPGPGLCPIPIG